MEEKHLLEIQLQNILNDVREIPSLEFPFARVILDGTPKWFTTSGWFWTEGFWIGLLVEVSKMTPNKHIEKIIMENYKIISRRKSDKNTHDLGFLFYTTAWQLKEKKPDLIEDISEAVLSLMSRYREQIGLISAWTDLNTGEEVFLIDTFMNLFLPFEYYELINDASGKERIKEIAHTMCRFFINNDGSINQAFSGKRKFKPVKVQGKSEKSCWARGLAWAIYGTSWFWGKTRDKIFKSTFIRLIDFLEKKWYELKRIPYDFEDSDTDIIDSSAAVIILLGLYNGKNINIRASVLFDQIWEWVKNNCLDRKKRLIHGCYHYPKHIFIDNEIIFGNYYFFKLLLALNIKEAV